MSVYQFKNLGFKLPEGSVLIKADEAAKLAMADDIVKSAKKRAVEIVQEAEAHFEEERARGLREGREAAQVQAFEQLLGEHVALDQGLMQIEQDLARLVTSSVRKIVQSFNDIDLSEALVHAALAKVRREKRVQIRLPEAVLEPFKNRLDQTRQTFPHIDFIELVEDPTLVAPNIVVETSVGRIDCDLGDKLDDIDAIIIEVARNMSASQPPQAEHGDV